ncbi:hypothetical protein [Nocardia sp. XZ_19_385]|uniref:hypothetical protein n=1 Tax=Nocardia sp. XZ_19_385 TaxID=2769488 RepID=UPI00188EFA5F|nr:hypothetical protein [Nocardia sp. XZ_19_385]
MSVIAIRILTGAFAAATALTIAIPATAAPTPTQTQSQSCLDLRLALNRAERELSQSNNTSQRSVLETRIRRLERQLLASNC